MYLLMYLRAFIWLYLSSGFVCMSMLWRAWQTLSLLFFAVISTESGLQIMLSAWRCGRFSRMPQMEWRHLWVPQPVSLWYARTHARTAAILLFLCLFIWWHFSGEWECEEGRNSALGHAVVAASAAAAGQTGEAAGRETGWHLFCLG